MISEVVHCRYGDLHIKGFEIDVPAVFVGRGIYFPLRTLCDRIGIGSQWQIEKVRSLAESDSRWSGALRDLPVRTIKGERVSACLNRTCLGRWFDTLDPPRCPITAQGPLKRLQMELETAADKFLFGGSAAGIPTHEHICPCCGRLVAYVGGEWVELED